MSVAEIIAEMMKHTGYILMSLAFVLAGTASLQAQESDRRDVRRGNREFRDGNFKEAAVDYQKALLRDSSSFAASYNLANALYRMGNFQEAKPVLDSVSKPAQISEYASDYWYNSGNVSVMLEDWQSAVDAYRESLLRNPGDLNAKENYIYAKKMLQNQQNQDGQDQQDQNDDQNQDGQDQQDRNDGQNQDGQDQQDRNEDQNQDGQDQQDQNDDQNQDGQNQQDQPQISKQAAQQMLNAIMAKEKETQDKVNKEKAAVLQSKQKEKNW